MKATQFVSMLILAAIAIGVTMKLGGFNLNLEDQIKTVTMVSPALNGNLMANGVPFDVRDMTIATRDRDIPFGTIIVLETIDAEPAIRAAGIVTDRMSKSAEAEFDLSPALIKRFGSRTKLKLRVIRIQ